jgi:hypothetical protein
VVSQFECRAASRHGGTAQAGASPGPTSHVRTLPKIAWGLRKVLKLIEAGFPIKSILIKNIGTGGVRQPGISDSVTCPRLAEASPKSEK